MTREGRSQKMKEAAARRKELISRLPGARLDNCEHERGAALDIEAGNQSYLRVAARGTWEPGRVESWREMVIWFHDPIALGEFIAALTARYNYIVDGMNSATSGVHLAQPAKISLDVTAPVKDA